MIDKALMIICPDAKWSLIGNSLEGLTWHDESTSRPTDAEILTKISELKSEEPLRLLRIERNRLLQETDWRFRSDLTPSQAWIDYCQALRDLPETQTPTLDENGNLINVNWPEPPTE